MRSLKVSLLDHIKSEIFPKRSQLLPGAGLGMICGTEAVLPLFLQLLLLLCSCHGPCSGLASRPTTDTARGGRFWPSMPLSTPISPSQDHAGSGQTILWVMTIPAHCRQVARTPCTVFAIPCLACMTVSSSTRCAPSIRPRLEALVTAQSHADAMNPGRTDLWLRFEHGNVEGMVLMLASLDESQPVA